MNRPPTPDRDLIRSVVVKIRTIPDQHKRWQAKAQQHGLSLSEWVRLTLDRAARM